MSQSKTKDSEYTSKSYQTSEQTLDDPFQEESSFLEAELALLPEEIKGSILTYAYDPEEFNPMVDCEEREYFSGHQVCISLGCTENYKVNKIIGRGTFGFVYGLTAKSGKQYVAKIFPIYPKMENFVFRPDLGEFDRYREMSERELANSKAMADLKLSPVIADAFYCRAYIRRRGQLTPVRALAIIMDRWDTSLDQLFKKDFEKFSDNLQIIFKLTDELINNYISNGLVHNDFYPRNIVVKLNDSGKVYQLTSIDVSEVSDSFKSQGPQDWMKSQLLDGIIQLLKVEGRSVPDWLTKEFEKIRLVNAEYQYYSGPKYLASDQNKADSKGNFSNNIGSQRTGQKSNSLFNSKGKTGKFSDVPLY